MRDLDKRNLRRSSHNSSDRRNVEESQGDRSWVKHRDSKSSKPKNLSNIRETEEWLQSFERSRSSSSVPVDALPKSVTSPKDDDDSPWSEEELEGFPPLARPFLEQIWADTEDETPVTAKKLLDWAKSRKLILLFQKGGKYISFIPGVQCRTHILYPLKVWSSGSFEVRLGTLHGPFGDIERKEQFRRKLNTVQFVFVPKKAVRSSCILQLLALNPDKSFDDFVRVLNWFVDVVEGS